jgi:hypothetical protein
MGMDLSLNMADAVHQLAVHGALPRDVLHAFVFHQYAPTASLPTLALCT